MKQFFRGRAGAIGACVVALAAASSALAGVKDLLTTATENNDWHVSDSKGDVTYTGDPKLTPTLVFHLTALREQPLKIELQTDASSWQLASGQDKVSITMQEKVKVKHILLLSADARDPTLSIDGAQPAQHLGRWIVLATHEGNDVLSLTFPGATYANLNVQLQSVEQSKGDGDTDAPAKLSPAEEKKLNPRLDQNEIASLIANARQSLVQVRVKTQIKDIYLASNGVILNRKGLVATSFTPLIGSEGATIVMPDGKTELPATLDCGMSTITGFVRVKFDPTQAPKDVAWAPAPLDLMARSGTRVWIVSCAANHAPAAGGIATIIPTHNAANADLTNRLDMNRCMNIVKAGIPPTPANNGGLLINSAGQAVGLTLWAFSPDSPDVGYAADSGTLQRLAAASETPKSWPDALKFFAPEDPAHRIMPMLIATHSIPAADLTRDAAQLRTNHACRVCKGTGEVTQRVKTGMKPEGGALKPVYSEVTQTCPSCKGNKLAVGAALPKLLEKTAADVFTADLDAKDMEKTLDLMHDTLRDIFSLSPDGLSEILNPAATQRLSAAKISPGTPIVFVGKRDSSPLPGDPQESILVRVGQTPLRVVIQSPNIVYSNYFDGRFLIGGLVSGAVRCFDGSDVYVVQSGFVVTTEVGGRRFNPDTRGIQRKK